MGIDLVSRLLEYFTLFVVFIRNLSTVYLFFSTLTTDYPREFISFSKILVSIIF